MTHKPDQQGKKNPGKRPLAGAAAMGAGPGRPKGVPNKVTGQVKEALSQAFDRVGGVDYVVRMAEEHPKAFLTMLARLVPNEIHAEVNLNEGLAEAIRKARERVK